MAKEVKQQTTRIVVAASITIACCLVGWWITTRSRKSRRKDQDGAGEDGSREAAASSPLRQLFEISAVKAKELKNITNGDRLMLYGLYKQATVGDCQDPAPSPLLLVDRAKHTAWCKFKGMSLQEAIVNYVEAVEELGKQGSDNEENMINGNDDNYDDYMISNSMGLKPSTLLKDDDENDSQPPDTSLESQLRHAASSSHDNESASLAQMQNLIQQGASVNDADENGQTALHFCSDRGFLKGTIFLIDHGADPNAADLDGISVLQAAVIAENMDICRVLMEHGADPDAQDDDGDSPRSCALQDGSDEMKALFRRQDLPMVQEDEEEGEI